jgi:hypothetical protein
VIHLPQPASYSYCVVGALQRLAARFQQMDNERNTRKKMQVRN